MADAPVCSACGGEKFLRPSSPWHAPHLICKPCFMVWYDPPGVDPIDVTKPDEVGRLSLEMKAKGEWPWVGEYGGWLAR